MHNFKRLNSQHKGLELPSPWTENITHSFEQYFNEQYAEILSGRHFQTYAQLFSDEILLVVSLVYKTNEFSPITFFISKDIDDKLSSEPTKAKRTLESMTELAGIFFNEILAKKEWSDYLLEWTSYDYKKTNYEYKVTRENIELTIQADEWLKDFDGVDSHQTEH